MSVVKISYGVLRTILFMFLTFRNLLDEFVLCVYFCLFFNLRHNFNTLTKYYGLLTYNPLA